MASDQDRFDAAYEAFRDLFESLYDIDTRQCARGVTSDDAPGVKLSDGQAKSRELVHLPRNWPLARLTIPLGGLNKQVDRLLEGYCFQILATNRDPDAHNGKIIQTATHLTLILAEYLADTIAWLMRCIFDHASKILFDTDTEPLLTPGFWILLLYRELLNSASRNRPSSIRESSGLHWLGLSVRKTRSREERESFMRERHTPTIGEASPFFFEQCCARHYNCGSHEAVPK